MVFKALGTQKIITFGTPNHCFNWWRVTKWAKLFIRLVRCCHIFNLKCNNYIITFVTWYQLLHVWLHIWATCLPTNCCFVELALKQSSEARWSNTTFIIIISSNIRKCFNGYNLETIIILCENYCWSFFQKLVN